MHAIKKIRALLVVTTCWFLGGLMPLSSYGAGSSDEEAEANYNVTDHIETVLAEFSDEHPCYDHFFWGMTVHGKEKSTLSQLMINQLKKESSVNMSDYQIIYQRLALILIEKYCGIKESIQKKIVERAYKKSKIRNCLETLALYHKLNSKQKFTDDDFDDIQLLIAKARETGFFPAVWFLMKVSLSHREYLSPLQAIEIIPSKGEAVISAQILAFSHAIEDGELINQNPESHLSTETEIRLTLLSALSEFKWQPSDPVLQATKCLIAGVKHTFFNPNDEDKCHALLKEKIGIDIPEDICGYFFDQNKRIISTKTNLAQGVYFASIGLSYRYCKLGKIDKPLSAKYLKVSAKKEFPLLYRDAGKIWLAYGHYQEAKKCFTALTNASINLHQSIQNEMNALVEHCEDAMEGDKEDVIEEGVFDIPPQKQPAASKPAKVSRMLTRKGGPSKPLTVASGLKKKVQEVGKDAPKAVATEKKVSSPSKAMEVTSGWVDDRSPRMRQFFTKLARYRRVCDLEGEKQLLEQNLQCFDDTYNRMREEAGWFYLRQLWLPYKYLLFEGDTASNQRQLIRLAIQNFEQAFANYLDYDQADFQPDRLKAVIEEYYMRQQAFITPEHRKRIRSILSSMAHAQDYLADYSMGKSRGAYKQRASQLFQLKRIADPEYYSTQRSEPAKKIQTIDSKDFFGTALEP